MPTVFQKQVIAETCVTDLSNSTSCFRLAS